MVTSVPNREKIEKAILKCLSKNYAVSIDTLEDALHDQGLEDASYEYENLVYGILEQLESEDQIEISSIGIKLKTTEPPL